MIPVDDPFHKLRTLPPPEADEVCACVELPALMLVAGMLANPVKCANCLCEVPPERLNYAVGVIDEIARWRRVANALIALWLDSGAYESWAATELEAPASAVNVRALELVQTLRGRRPIYYWWFNAVTPVDLDWSPPTDCPVCAAPLHPTAYHFGFALCHTCGVAVEVLDVDGQPANVDGWADPTL